MESNIDKGTLSARQQNTVMIAYLVSIKQVPTTRGMMNFGIWFDVEGTHFDNAHFSDSLTKYPFIGGGSYLLQGKVHVDYSFSTINIEKMARLPFIPDPRYEDDKDLKNKAQGMLK